MRKQADTPPAVGALPSISPVPEVSIVSQLPTGKKGPTGLAPRTNYSRVNAGAVTAPEGLSQNPIPKYGSPMNEHTRPSLQQLVLSTLGGAVSRTKLAEEAARQQAHSDGDEDDKCEKCHKEKDACSCGKTASASSVSTEYTNKVANALDFLADVLSKEAEGTTTNKPGEGPGALQVSESISGSPPSEDVGKATAKNTVPANPPEEKAHPAEQSATAMATNDHSPPGAGAAKTPEKVAASPEDLLAKNLEVLGVKVATAPSAEDLLARNLEVVGVKVAEDAANPAHVSAGSAVAPEASASGQPGGQPVAGAPKGPTHGISSNQAAIDLTRGQAYANRAADMKQWLTEPMDSKAHDKVLANAFAHTSEAGPKIAEAQTKTAAAKALLSQLAAQVQS